MIVAGSRYESADLQPVLRMGRDRGTTDLAAFRREPEAAGSRYVLVMKSGYRWDYIASRSSSNPEEWWKVLDVNDEIIDPFTVAPGTRISIP